MRGRGGKEVAVARDIVAVPNLAAGISTRAACGYLGIPSAANQERLRRPQKSSSSKRLI